MNIFRHKNIVDYYAHKHGGNGFDTKVFHSRKREKQQTCWCNDLECLLVYVTGVLGGYKSLTIYGDPNGVKQWFRYEGPCTLPEPVQSALEDDYTPFKDC